MGRIRISCFRRPEAQPQEVLPVDDKFEKETVEHIERIDIDLEESAYPIIPRKTKDADLPFLTPSEVNKRNGQGGNRLWIVVSNTVLDVTEYMHKHPGGSSIIAGFAGHDCTWQWYSFHDRSIWEGIAVGLRVGRTESVSNPHKRPPGIVGLRRFGFDDWE